jgi:5-formyltetrahydrofolate cyclo-ligase
MTRHSNPANKKNVRRNFRALRQSLTHAEQHMAALSLFRLLANHPLFAKSRNIAFYVPNDGELDPGYLFEEALNRRKSCYLPCIADDFHNPRQDRLVFSRTEANTPLLPNKFGILEPNPEPRSTISARALNLVLVPLVAFDLSCNRLGMGKGYYDRTFEFIKQGNYWHRPILVGLAHECQKSPGLLASDWDIPLDAIASNEKIYTCQPHKSGLKSGA